jgi:NADH-quinone oxidoreductase subunit H
MKGMDLLIYAIQLLLYPGISFALAAGLFSEWFTRKLYARFQNRRGPTYTGPFGILQPLADFLKLMLKEDIATRVSGDKAVLFMLSLSLGALCLVMLFTPLAVRGLAFPYDAVLVIYLLIIPSLVFALVGYASYNPFGIYGSSRVVVLLLGYEPAFLLSIFMPMFATPGGFGFSVMEAASGAWRLWSGPTAIPMAIALATALISLQCKLMEKPFDIPHAEVEIVGGPFTEYSGPKLAYIGLLHDFELVVGGVLITYLLLGGAAPFQGPLGALAVLIKFLAVVSVVTLIKAVFGRFRIDQASNMLWRYVILIALADLILAAYVIPKLA